MKKLVAESEHYHSEILRMEAQQEDQIRASGQPLDQHIIYLVGKALEANPWYNRAISKRNSAAVRATMYGIAAIVLGEEE
jgi:hypothetical protein